MPFLALGVLVAWLVLVTVVRGAVTYRRTGTVPRPPPVERGSPRMWARVLSSAGIVLAAAAPIAELAGLGPIAILDHPAGRWAGLALALLGIAGVLGAQLAMGDSWMPDIDPDARTELVTTGPFGFIRNPILACMAIVAIGLALMVPNVLAILMLAAFIGAIQVQVRLVEEPHLLRTHGDAYRRYAARTGRFLPGVGRLAR